MKLVLIFGGIAVGKMTVAQELVKITGLRLFHNHMTIEPVLEVFGEFRVDVILRLRDVIFEDFVHTTHDGMVFTGCWALQSPGDWQYFEGVTKHFTAVGGEVHYVNLVTSQEVRLTRNETENRIKHKPSMRQTDVSRARLIETDIVHRWEAADGEFNDKDFIKIDNTNLAPDVVAQMIKDRFNL
ncbi:MAG: AAA family ATPase [Defluviitaleaceae bacterium]|nr:AAA family ATPase [Defluviitaleaceae bacterium]